MTYLLESGYLLLVGMDGGREFPVHLLHLSAGPLVGLSLHLQGPLQLTVVPLQSQ